jgi:hypothetical protein
MDYFRNLPLRLPSAVSCRASTRFPEPGHVSDNEHMTPQPQTATLTERVLRIVDRILRKQPRSRSAKAVESSARVA